MNNADKKYTYKYGKVLKIKSSINFQKISSCNEAVTLAEEFVEALEQYQKDNELFYDCSEDSSGEIQNREEPFILVHRAGSFVLKQLESFCDEEKYVVGYIAKIREIFNRLQEQYNQILAQINTLRDMKQVTLNQFIDRAGLDTFVSSYNVGWYFERTKKIADFWQEKQHQYSDHNNDINEDRKGCSDEEEETVFDLEKIEY